MVLRFWLEDVHVVMFSAGERDEFDWKVGIRPYEEWKHAFCGELRWDACP